MKRWWVTAWLLCLCTGSALGASSRVALVIGNGAYLHESALSNPVNDGRLIADTLRALGFEVQFHRDLDRRAMELAIAPLRERVREALAACGPQQARLAAVYAVMAQALAPHERRLLGGLPGWLEKRSQRMGQQGVPEAALADTLRQELQALLLAELEHRLQPVEGLIAALRPSPTSPSP